MNKKKLQEYALFAEVMGGIAVLITLIFLVIETRENTNAIQAQTYQSLTSELNDIRYMVISSGFSETYLKYAKSGFVELSSIEAFEMLAFSQALWGVYESAFYAKERGVLGVDEYLRFQHAMCRNYVADQAQWKEAEKGALIEGTVAKGLSKNLTPKFSAYVETLCR